MTAQKKDTKQDVKKGVKKAVVVPGVVPGIIVRLQPFGIATVPGLFLTFWAFSASTNVLLDAIAPYTSPVTASEVLQDLVETGATLYGVSSCVSTQKQLVDLGTTEHYTQGLEYVDCEAEATFCGLMNVTSYPTWQLNGQLYEEHYPLEQLSELLDDLHNHHGRHHSHHLAFIEILPRVFLLSIWLCGWVWCWANLISIIIYGEPLFVPNPSGKAKGAPTDVSSRIACVVGTGPGSAVVVPVVVC